MGSDGGGGGNPQALYANAAPMQGLPIVGKDSSAVGNPYDYGKFQNFLPDAGSDGKYPVARGLTPDMFTYKSPSGAVAPGVGDQISDLRTQLAKLSASGTGTAATTPNNVDQGQDFSWQHAPSS
jgi:hypothetical protein